MRLSLKIPIITAWVLLCTLIVNALWLWFSLSRHMPLYVESTEQANQQHNITLTPENLQTLLSTEEIDGNTRSEYQQTLTELTNITQSLRSLSENPELYISPQTTPANENAFHINLWSGQVTLTFSEKPSIIESFLNIFHHIGDIQIHSAEAILLFGVIQDFFILNAVWFLFIILLYTLWIRHIFSPIRLINDRLQSFFHLTPIQKIPYTKQDEFQPLIETVHTLHTSLKAQEEIRSQFLSDLSHEIRTPMTSIQCMLEAIDDGIMKLDSNTIILIQNEITRLVTITNRVMDYESFLHSTQNITEKKSTPIQHITDTIIQQYQPQLQKTDQKIIEHIPKNCIITLHSDLYIHILHNIFSNFIKYAWSGTILECRYKKTSSAHQIHFIDNGRGIPTEHIPFIKEKFYREDTGRTQGEEGSMGIGLSIVDRIMTLHEGSLHIDSSPNNGFSLILSFPLSYE